MQNIQAVLTGTYFLVSLVTFLMEPCSQSEFSIHPDTGITLTISFPVLVVSFSHDIFTVYHPSTIYLEHLHTQETLFFVFIHEHLSEQTTEIMNLP